MTFDIRPKTLYEIECWREGTLLWSEQFYNLVTTVGRNKLLDACFRTGESANAWFVGLVDFASFTAYSPADTMLSHAGWLESVIYSQATRPAFVGAAATQGSLDNGASRATFTLNGAGTVRGAFLVDNSAKSGTTGVLYGEGDFVVARNVLIGDTINAKLTLTD